MGVTNHDRLPKRLLARARILSRVRGEDDEGMIYFIEDQNEKIKIGFATDALCRLRALQVAHADDLILLAVVKGQEL